MTLCIPGSNFSVMLGHLSLNSEDIVFCSISPVRLQQNLGPYLDPNHHSASVPERKCFEKVHFEKSQQTQKNT